MNLSRLPNYNDENTGIFKMFNQLFSPMSNKELGQFMSRFVTFAILISGTIFFVKLITAGYGYMTSAGDQTKVQNATKELTNAAIGLVVTISAYFAAQIIQVIFGIKII